MKNFLLSIIFISATYAALYENCSETRSCSVPDKMKCGDEGKCVCDTPWFTPCNSSVCNVKPKINYEGDECRSSDNCLINAICNTTENKCRCKDDFTSLKGLCYKSLNSTCQKSDECWSRECRDNQCQCPVGYNPKDNNRCTLNLAKVYTNWTLAREANDFCHDSFSCMDSLAICQNDSIHSEKFCQCPSTHTLNKKTGSCDWKFYDGLSPSIVRLSNDTCGKCKVSNAICARGSNQTTCWCRASYEAANGNTCNKKRLNLIFPSQRDLLEHKYSLNCFVHGADRSIQNDLCVCASGYEFIKANASCQQIIPQWINDQFEYDVCTKINSQGVAVREDGLCPHPLTCEAREDKHVCSCGQDKFYDQAAKKCFSYLNRNVTNARCPEHSIWKNSQCQCDPADVYLSVDDNKQCELKLNPIATSEDPICNSTDLGNRKCAESFHGYAKFCKQGECRCMLNNSFYENNKCITLIHAPAIEMSHCPTNANADNGVCQCNPGYRVDSTKRSCEKLTISLSNFTSNSIQESNPTITYEDCQALFPRQYVNVSNNTCVCQQGTFADKSVCIFQLNYTFPNNANIAYHCPKFASNVSDSCQCQLGYRSFDDYTCVAKQQHVYEYDSKENCSEISLTNQVCKNLFGNAAEKNDTSHCCHCQNSNIAFLNDNRCYFLINVHQTESIEKADCPSTSNNENQMCVCPKHYPTSPDKKTCATTPDIPFKPKTIDPKSARSNSTCQTSDCELLHGSGTICHENTCYCDRTKSFVHKDRCELYTKYVFPGEHQRYAYACETDDDCGQNGIVCDYLMGDDYKVCQCRQGYYLNPAESKCVTNLCEKTCGENEECQGYECVCKREFYRDSSNKCVQFNTPVKLYDKCNQTLWYKKEFQCSYSCQHWECAAGYHDDNKGQCVAYKFVERCAHDPYLCTRLSSNAYCNFDENTCTCLPGYYQTNDEIICAKPIGSSCTTSRECGELGSCENSRCQCVIDAEGVDFEDFYGRKMKICRAKTSNVDQFKSHPLSILILLFIHLFFA